jgi:hypothetical protein
MKCKIGSTCGASPTLVASGQELPHSIAVDADSVYWTAVNAGVGVVTMSPQA